MHVVAILTIFSITFIMSGDRIVIFCYGKCRRNPCKLSETGIQKTTRARSLCLGGGTLSRSEFFRFGTDSEPLFKFACTYLDMVNTMLCFIKAVRSADWNLSLGSLHDFLKYFFAFDKLNYARMISLYLSEMDRLNRTDPEIWEHFINGNWVVNRNEVPFCALGADEALEHQNKRLKVQGGLIGITQNDNARNRFFLVNPELNRVVDATEKMLGRKKQRLNKHHEQSKQIEKRQDSNIMKMKEEFKNTTNPFECKNSDLTHILSHRVFSEEINHFVKNVKDIGKTLQDTFFLKRIETNEINFWAPMKKNQAKTFATATKNVNIKSKNDIIAMKTDFSLIARLLIASRTRKDIDVKFNISTYEFSPLPKSLFGVDGEMHHCPTKSKLLEILESFQVDSNQEQDEDDPAPMENGSGVEFTDKKAAILDGMTFLHTYSKPVEVRTCADLGANFANWLHKKFREYDEVHVIFDTYKANSLKSATRKIRQHGKDPVQYKIHKETKVATISMTKLLSDEKTKDDLTAFLSGYILEVASKNKRKFVVSYRNEAKSSDDADVSCLGTTQEEADTKIILHGVYLAQQGTRTTHIYSPDTDVVVLALRRVPQLSPEIGIFVGPGMKKFIDLATVYHNLGPLKASVLPGLHALSGADVTGYFTHKGKKTWWKSFQGADERLIKALSELGTASTLSEDVKSRLEEFVCQVYIPKTILTDIGEVRWWLFTKKQCQDECLPPTKAALEPALLRAHLQVFEWNQDVNQHPKTLSPSDFGWKKCGDKYEPIPCNLPCAPDLVWDLCRCTCTQKRCALPCICRSQGLKCTEMCKCEGSTSSCDNFEDDQEEEEEDCEITGIEDMDFEFDEHEE